MIYAGKEIKAILIGNRVLTSAYVGSVNVYVSAKPFSECTWAEIKEIADAGLASQYFALGDTKTDTDANNVVHTYRIVQFGYGGNALLLEDLNPLQGPAVWNSASNVDDDSCSNNYSISSMRTTTLPAIFLTYPSALRSVISETSYKVAKNGETTSPILELTDKLFLGAIKEYIGVQGKGPQSEAAALSQFALYSENDTDAFRAKYNSENVDSVYFTRSSGSGYPAYVCWLSGTSKDLTSVDYGRGYASPLFAIGDYATRTIPYIGNSTLTASYVSAWASKIQASVRAGCVKVIVPADFTNYESGAIDAIFAAFPNMETIQSPWLNGTKTDGMEWSIPYVSGTTSTALTASHVEASASKLGNQLRSLCKKINVPSYFTGYETNVLNFVDNANYGMPNAVSVSFGFRTYYSRLPFDTSTIKNVKYIGTTIYNDSFEQFNHIETFEAPNATSIMVYGIWSNSKLKTISIPLITGLSPSQIGGNGMKSLTHIYANSLSGLGSIDIYPVNPKVFIGTSGCSLSSSDTLKVIGVYFAAPYLASYMADSNWSSFGNKLIGVLDGANVYSKYGFSYSKISTTLTIDANGHLIENGVDMFAEYTATWYSDEDCTTVIADPTTIAATDTAYVKLTAI